ncbi:phosphonate metabolism transcriptional regulator PhnF [Agrobacterium tumefaciens]|uniref:phosphonate metabolism transcriptional regulator PhnF n=1 Tax=Agrobacterium tumefaciens TaxID=358 RepID=UPI001574AA70|nr:phosphonate metabolism transcriptional regulator PhnF [Agrobacterium tumefaciens]NTE66247.1 phosphonate metabolism transcriptional regulator PhnF [Agrobacterium tumefaciens]
MRISDGEANGDGLKMAVWQNISDTLVKEIEAGVLEAGGRLPGDVELATRFGVNRHTVRRALSHLQTRGLVRSERGRGTFVVEDAIAYHIGSQTRFEQSLLENMRVPTRQLLSLVTYPAPAAIAEHLKIRAGSPILTVTLLGEANSIPVHYASIHFSVERFANVETVFSRIPTGKSMRISLSELMAELGVENFRRKTVRIRCRLPEEEEARHLKMSAQDPVFQLEILNVDDSDTPVFFGVTAYCGSRVDFVLNY